MIEILDYSDNQFSQWNDFVTESIADSIILSKKYSNYHSDKFIDSSSLIYDKGKLVAVFLGNSDKKILYGHQGLTFGGFIFKKTLNSEQVIEIVYNFKNYAKEKGFNEIKIKIIPDIFLNEPFPAYEYSLIKNKFTLSGCNLNFYIDTKYEYKFKSNLKRDLNKLNEFTQEHLCNLDCENFISILNDNLKKHNKIAPHNADELNFLINNHSEKIKIISLQQDKLTMAASLIFINDNSIHTQYLCQTEKSFQVGLLKKLIDLIITDYKEKRYISFGVATEGDGSYINKGLARFKESFGAKTGLFKEFSCIL